MFAWLKRALGLDTQRWSDIADEPGAVSTPPPPPPPEPEAVPLWKRTIPEGAWPMIELQRAYWRTNPDELQALLDTPARDPQQQLRLYHLLCMLLAEHPEGQKALREGALGGAPLPVADALGEHAALFLSLRGELFGPEGRWRPQAAQAWHGSFREADPENPDFSGLLSNASMTHSGALEVYRLDEQHQPVALEFCPLSALEMIVLGPPMMFRICGLRYADGRSENVLVPQIYGISWDTGQEMDLDGSMTRFVCSLQEVDGSGIGVGHQDILLGDRLMGMASVGLVRLCG